MHKLFEISSIALFLCALVPLWLCLLPSTSVEESLQIKLFMQNKAKFPKSQMNVINVITKEYEKKDTWWSGKKQSQTKPNKANLLNAQMNVKFYSTKDYEKISNWAICENKAKLRNDKNQCKPLYQKGL